MCIPPLGRQTQHTGTHRVHPKKSRLVPPVSPVATLALIGRDRSRDLILASDLSKHDRVTWHLQTLRRSRQTGFFLTKSSVSKVVFSECPLTETNGKWKGLSSNKVLFKQDKVFLARSVLWSKVRELKDLKFEDLVLYTNMCRTDRQTHLVTLWDPDGAKKYCSDESHKPNVIGC